MHAARSRRRFAPGGPRSSSTTAPSPPSSRRSANGEAALRIVWTKPSGQHLGAEKGINVPCTVLSVPALTADGDARGDLAVGIGFEYLAEVPRQTVALCEAAHIPAIWATQVLENLAKTGQPLESRNH